ncbi:MAG: ATP-binding protein [Desulfuromonadales bacterium]
MTDFKKNLRLEQADLAWKCEPEQFEFRSTDELPPLEGTIGQDRALSAINFGLEIGDDGFNIFILGEPGTGRSSTIKNILHSRAKDQPVPEDWCYVHDFEMEARPKNFTLPSGKGRELKKDVDELVERLAEEIPKAFEGKEYEEQKSSITSAYAEKNKELLKELEEEAQEAGFNLQRTVSGLVLVPTRNGEPISQEDYQQLSEEEKSSIDERGEKLQEKLNEVLREIRDQEKKMREDIHEMEQSYLFSVMGHLFEVLEEKYKDYDTVLEHFENVKKDILDRLDEFRPNQQQVALPGMSQEGPEEKFERYKINLFIDHSESEGAPVVYEPNPTYFNLFGRIEHTIQMGNASTNFTMIKPGALHRANGGYLVLDCREVLINPFTYEALKRSIRNQEIKIEDMMEQFRLIATVSLKPQPIPLDCRIILIGTPIFYYLLYQLDDDFRKYFKVKADFDRMMKNTAENIQQYALFIASKSKEEGTAPFDPSGVARVVEHSARLIADKNRLSSRFLDIADLIRESAFYAHRQDKEMVDKSDVETALEAKIYRSNKLEERIQEAIDEGTLLIDTSGEVVGQVNGLSVYMMGDYAFGRPSRVTVRTYFGKSNVVNIEREAKISGSIHDKGVMILTGFFGARYAQDKPLSMSASICFEQSYGGVEGDSASTTELYGLLSSLSDLPIRQGVAVTGSVDQRGIVQPIGGVNEKVEGFYAVCKAQGLTGEQGVIIPKRNVKNLMLKQEVIEAVENGDFHVWAVENVDEGIEILTGVPAGEKQEDGTWPSGTVNALVDEQLLKLADINRNFSQGKNNGND